MRVLYLTINESISSETAGVSNKILNKVLAIRNKVEFCFLLNARLSLNHNDIVESGSTDSLIEVEIGVEEANKGYFNVIKRTNLFYKKLVSFIKSKNFQETRIIMRYPMASRGLLAFISEFPKRVVLEHNTKEIEEIHLQISKKKYAKFSLKPSEFFFWFQEKIMPIYDENWLSKRIFAQAHSGACVTKEIAEHEKRKCRSYKTFVASNFYNVKGTHLQKRTYFSDTEPLVLGMIVTTMAPWYGLDRLLKSFAHYQTDFKLVIAGIDKEDESLKALIDKYKISTNLEVIGKIGKNDLGKFYANVHVCFGSLGLYKIGLSCASTLKVKEAVSFGIPVVLGYQEEDFFENKKFIPYYYQVANDESVINFDDLKVFANGFYSNVESQQNLRKLALEYLDVDVKVDMLLRNIA